MCFSAGASFASGGVLGGIGMSAIWKAKRFRAIAIVPLLFAVQQFIEGLIWLSPQPSTLSNMLGYGFLFFAYLFWPVYTPLAVLSVEKRKRKRIALKGLAVAGLIIATYAFAALLTQPMTVAIMGKHIVYEMYVPFFHLGILLYTMTVIGSLLISSHRFLRLFGILVFLSAAASYFLFYQAFTSVWCFFAALLSVYLWHGLRRAER